LTPHRRYGYDVFVDAPKSEFFTMNEAAQELGLSPATVRQAVLAGRLPHVIRYEKRLISREALENYRTRTQPNGLPKPGRPPKT
jgi:excisionase family DNA binding protein